MAHPQQTHQRWHAAGELRPPATARRPTTLTAVARPAGEVAGLLLWRSCAARGPGRPCSALPDR
jgi:hypothetical protein